MTSATPSRSCEPGSARTGSRSSSTTPTVRVASTSVASGSPAKQVRQFAFRDSDSTLTAVWVERYGAWTAESLARRRLTKRIDRIEEEAATAAKQAARTEQRLRARIAELEAGGPVDCAPAVAEALDAERVAIRDLVEARRTAA